MSKPVLVHTLAELEAAKTEQIQQLRAANETQPPADLTVGLVPTMGALHAGHQELIHTAAQACDLVILTIFVNPLQFGDPEDLKRYPKTLDADLKIAQQAGADIVFAPSANEFYPQGEPRVRVSAGEVGSVLEGAARPGHFDGMLTVVAKLLHVGAPHHDALGYLAFFGQKDAQQLALIRTMVQNLNFPVHIVAVPTVRDQDGLALSSRNRFLSAEERERALVLSKVLFTASERRRAGEKLDVEQLRAELENTPGVSLDYLALVDGTSFSELREEDLEPYQEGGNSAVLVVAAKLGSVRLIDNLPL